MAHKLKSDKASKGKEKATSSNPPKSSAFDSRLKKFSPSQVQQKRYVECFLSKHVFGAMYVKLDTFPYPYFKFGEDLRRWKIDGLEPLLSLMLNLYGTILYVPPKGLEFKIHKTLLMQNYEKREFYYGIRRKTEYEIFQKRKKKLGAKLPDRSSWSAGNLFIDDSNKICVVYNYKEKTIRYLDNEVENPLPPVQEPPQEETQNVGHVLDYMEYMNHSLSTQICNLYIHTQVPQVEIPHYQYPFLQPRHASPNNNFHQANPQDDVDQDFMN
ncbi:hypothetical protein KIW84_054557 [Lathyrus oleraceus]|uniref:Uncharacterized protein n=1 Tax=Pisum sativum TaxID=3888 RepID=A0A9D4WTD7_PEA|nr:hypothetical protein KIW84_054557 [Pisum sativum]